MDYFFLLGRLNGVLVILFHSTLFVMNRKIEDLLYVVCMALSGPAIANVDKIRQTFWYRAIGICATWVCGIGVTISMTKGANDIAFDPVILPWIVSIFIQLNCTLTWYGGTISCVC